MGEVEKRRWWKDGRLWGSLAAVIGSVAAATLGLDPAGVAEAVELLVAGITAIIGGVVLLVALIAGRNE